MPTSSSGRIVKTRTVKKGTPHQKNHRWESFTTKISKLSSLDPIRKVRRHDIRAEDLSTNVSYFKSGLEKWQELNISGAFVDFCQETLPMCDSLPQILHFEDTIISTLFSYIERKERECLQPLLELLSNFAHDLGTRFERHYAKALELITSIAGSHQDVDVIEWCFTCLTFMFKYLSKLLIPDLRPTYDLIAPLLGKQRQQPHIARFAAEAMSFLIKKAGSPAHREKALPLIVEHAKSDLKSISSTKQFGLYYHGLMTMFAEAIKGNGLTVHTSGPAIFSSLFIDLDDKELTAPTNSLWMDLTCGVLTSVLHHTNSDTFKSIFDVVLQTNLVIEDISASELSRTRELGRLLLSARMLGTIAAVRKGTRVDDWPLVLKNISSILLAVSNLARLNDGMEQDHSLWKLLVLSAAIILQYSPMDAAIPFISSLMDSLTKDPLSGWFLTFCSYFSRTEPERFRSMVQAHFQRFVITHWSNAKNGDALCVLLPRMVSSGVIPINSRNDGFALPQSWQDQIVSKFERLEIQPFPEQVSLAAHDRSPETWHDRCLPKYNALLEVLDCAIVHPSTNARISEIILRKLKLALRPSSSLASEEAHFIVGRGFTAFSRMTKGLGGDDKSLKPLLRAAAPRYARLPNFLEALLEYETRFRDSPLAKDPLLESQVTVSGSGVEEEPWISCLSSNLSTESHDLRLLSLRLLEQLYTSNHELKSEALSVMIMVEQTTLNLQTSRSVSMHIRKLASLYPHQTQQWIKQSIVHFCFGMFTLKFSQIWEDASAALKQIAEIKEGEESVANIAFQWLEMPSLAWKSSPKNTDQSNNKGFTDFECSNLMDLNRLADAAELEVSNARDHMFAKFKVAQQLIDCQPTSAREQALRVLCTVPSIAEKRSKKLVPMFLSWATKQGDIIEQSIEDTEFSVSNWSRKDQKTQLELFGLFTNPKSLYKSIEVYDALLYLLANGDIDIQKSALKAIFTWKDSNISPYEENLHNLLDEARFKEEIGILLHGDSHIQPERRRVLMPVLLRILYGRSISRKGIASGRQGVEARRLTVLRNLGIGDIGDFLDIALGSLKDLKLLKEGCLQHSTFDDDLLSARKQVGFTNMMEAVLKELKSKTAPFIAKLLDAVLYCTVYASRRLQGEMDGADEADDDKPSQTSLFKAVRQTGLKCLIHLFNSAERFDWSPYINAIREEIILPRLDNLSIETAQSVSGVLRLLFAWSSSPETVLLLASSPKILPKIAECLAPHKSKDEVKLFALSIIENVMKMSREDASLGQSHLIKNELLDPNMDHFLTEIGGVLRNQHGIGKALLETCVQIVADLASFVSTSSQAYNLVDVSVFLLDQPSRRVSPKTKSALLLVLEHFVPIYDLQNDPSLKDRVYNTITSLFGFFKDNDSRQVLSRVLAVYSQKDPVLGEVASLCMDINAFRSDRLDQPDYDRRLKAFNAINSTRLKPFTARQWTPILFNLLFYIKHDEEFGVLSANSSDSICQFIDSASDPTSEPRQEFKSLLSTILIPALFSGVREQSEIIRREYVKVMAHVVRTFPAWTDVNDMYDLLAGHDELESSFFNNVLTAGKGRQSSALGQLNAAAETGQLSSKNVSHFFIPLVEHFILNRAEGSEAHSIAAEATITVGILAGSLEWPQYRALLRRFIGYIEGKPELEKQIIRLLGKVIDALSQAPEDINSPLEAGKHSRTLAKTMPKQAKLAEDLSTNVLPLLTAYLHQKDDSTVSLRVPVAIIIVRLLKLLPQQQLNERLPPVLTDICQILRSKAQESRDMTRDTLAKICALLGPSCFGFVLKELRGALTRGYQVHVLSYTVHSILVATTPEYAPGSLDYCLPVIVNIIMDDIFGAAGQEKDADEYVSKMKEVKSSKSHDSMELIARTATLSRMTDLIEPIQVLLREKLTLKMTRKIDELLSRISSGLLKNPAAHSRDSLIFCYEIIQQVYTSDKLKEKPKQDYRLKRYLIQKAANRGDDRGRTTISTYKLAVFAFDVLRSVLKKYDDLRTSQNLAGFIPILGDAVVRSEEEVKVATFKLLTTIIKVPLKAALDGANLYKVATAEAIRSISSSSTTASETSQAALKLLSVVLRDRSDIPVKDTAVDELLNRLKDDMTEPDRRHVTFSFLRAVMDSKVETATVYDTLDYAGTIMVTNDDKDTRDLARGAYFQFLRGYPQKRNRWTKQLAFIVANLKYDREGGRLSILEVIHLLLSKSSVEYVQEVSATSFVPLIFVLANDDSEKCRIAAGEVLKEILKKADKERMATFLALLRSWAAQSENPSVVRLALQVFGFYYESQNEDDSDVSMLLDCILSSVNTTKDPSSDWEQIFAALHLASILLDRFPEKLLSSSTHSIWPTIWTCLSYPHTWVKGAAAKLARSYFASFVSDSADITLWSLPLKGAGGLELLDSDITTMTKLFANMFRTPNLTVDLAEDIVKNLFFLGAVAGTNNLFLKPALDEDDEAMDDDAANDNNEAEDAVLDYLFKRLSFIIRKETSPPRAAGLIAKTAALSLLERLVSRVPAEIVTPSLQNIILPLHNLTDPSIPTPYSIDEQFRLGHESLKSNADSLLEHLKRRVGTKEFTEAMVKVREGVKDKRQVRIAKRRVEAVAQPEKYGSQKKRKGERKKERRKEKGQQYGRRRNEF